MELSFLQITSWVTDSVNANYQLNIGIAKYNLYSHVSTDRYNLLVHANENLNFSLTINLSHGFESFETDECHEKVLTETNLE